MSRDELRRDLRAAGAAHRQAQRHLRDVVEGILASDAPADEKAAAFGLSRRSLLRAGGYSVGMAAVLSACAKANSGEGDTLPGVAGTAPTTAPPVTPVVNDVVLLRTATSLEYNAVDAYTVALDSGLLAGAAAEIGELFREHHLDHADTFSEATVAAGGEAYGQKNPEVDKRIVQPALALIQESDRPEIDVLSFALALESLAGETYQFVVKYLSAPALRKAAMEVGAVEHRHAAVLARAIAPGQVVPGQVAEGADFPNAVEAPWDFGSLAGVPVTLGPESPETGARTSLTLETPYLNSFIY
jgi:hypothetical protein